MSQVTVTQVNRNVTVTEAAANLLVTTGNVSSPHGTFTHSQNAPASTWVINHNLGCKPSVTIVDSAGNVQIGEVLYSSDNQITITFVSAFGGYAYLN